MRGGGEVVCMYLRLGGLFQWTRVFRGEIGWWYSACTVKRLRIEGLGFCVVGFFEEDMGMLPMVGSHAGILTGNSLT